MSWREEQEQFWGWITRPQDLRVDAGRIDGLFAPHTALDKVDALAIYNNAFHQRLIQIASEMYPVLYHTLGRAVFAQLWLGYLAEHLPRPGPMARLADHLLDYARAHPQFGALPALHDIIEVESLMLVLFDRADEPALPEAQLAQLPAEQWPTLRLTPRNDWAVVSSAFDLAAYWRQMQDRISTSAEPGSAEFGVQALPRGEERSVLIQRCDFRMQLQPISDTFAQFLKLLENNADFASLCEQLGSRYPGQDVPRLSLTLLLDATRRGLIRAT